MKNKVFLLTIVTIAFLVGTITSPTLANADKDNDKNPFKKIWDAIHDLQNQINKIQDKSGNNIGIITFGMLSGGCTQGFFGSVGGGCVSSPSDMPNGLQVPLPSSGTLHNLYVDVSIPVSGTYTIYVNNIPTTLTCTTSTTITCSDSINTVKVNAGDNVMIFENTNIFAGQGSASVVLSQP